MTEAYRRVFRKTRAAQQQIIACGALSDAPGFGGLHVALYHQCNNASLVWRCTEFTVWTDLRKPLICRHCKGRIDE